MVVSVLKVKLLDIPIGLPILTTVFGPHHPLEGLIYLTAPISLLFLNPIGFVLLELGKDKASRGKAEKADSKGKSALGTLFKVTMIECAAKN